ncbi:DUF397 domain-containing protein [Streptomyces paludis]|uniref:DUF397 domain-containing protein n=1 Tax=Streptomyces paludis TaxID=2282738 RepID=A0A345HU03_9ACTN|nr:DUF397 domain-containing protein [Streptomyces paludis]AXG80177.1 DUF397 domain-containing protein [Streptomyces paludis]
MKTEDTAAQLSGLTWSKSSHSGSDGGDCVEVAMATTTIHIRDSKKEQGPTLRVPAPAWTDFITFAGRP